jgi:biotin carboxylase
MLKQDEDTHFVVVGSNADGNCVYRAVCDEWVTEPDFDERDGYVDFCLDFCRQHRIDVFVPHREMASIARRLDEFDVIGVKVLAERDYPTMSALCDKARTYRMFEDAGIDCVPPYCTVTSAAEFETAYSRLKTYDNRVCLKFTSDEGAASFHVVDDNIECNLVKNIGTKITFADAVKALSRLGKFPDLLVMPYLSGVEVSIDCLSMPHGEHIVIPRYKSSGRSETIKYEPEIVNICRSFLDKFDLRYPFNVQFKYEDDVPYLLEINPRMSGGIQLSCAATGVNIPDIAVNRLLGVEKRQTWDGKVWDRKTRVVSFVETPIILG